ncbi:MAG: hypothetical protein ACRD3R_12035, partial [Terriglobales bacterium]
FKDASPVAVGAFAVAMALFAVGFQVHFSVNSAPAYLKHAQPSDLEHLMPVFWIGFNLLMLPATLLARRYGGVPVMAIAGVVGVLSAWFAGRAPTLDALIVAQFVVGGAWGVMLMSAFTTALAVGHAGHEGNVTGLLFSMLAVAALARIAFVSAEMPKQPVIAEWLPLLPVVVWGLGAILVMTLGLRKAEAASAS